MPKPLRINWIHPRSSLSGGVKSNRLIAEAMVRRGHKVTFAYVDLPPNTPPVWRFRSWLKCQLDKRRGVDPKYHHLVSSSAELIPVTHSPILANDVPDADFSIATWWETAEWIRDWPPEKGIKAYFVRHHELHGGPKERVTATYRQPMLKLVISKWLKELMADVYGDADAVLVPNGVDKSQFSYFQRPRQAQPTVGFMYGIQRWKGAHTAFEALQKVQETYSDLRVLSFGPNSIEQQNYSLKNFYYTLKPSQDQIAEIYRTVDVWIVPSITEGFGMPGLEAAACGCPLVVTKCGGAEDYLVHGRNGYLVEVERPDQMARAVSELLQSSEKEWQSMSAASAKIAEGFDWDQSAIKLEKALWQCLKK